MHASIYAIVALGFVLSAGCTTTPQQEYGELEPFISFDEIPLSESSSTMTFKLDKSHRPVAEKSMLIMCECTRLTVERGFRYFYIDERQKTVNWGRFRITFFDSPPEGIPVVNLTAPGDPTKGPDPMTSVIETDGLTRICNRYQKANKGN